MVALGPADKNLKVNNILLKWAYAKQYYFFLSRIKIRRNMFLNLVHNSQPWLTDKNVQWHFFLSHLMRLEIWNTQLPAVVYFVCVMIIKWNQKTYFE